MVALGFAFLFNMLGILNIAHGAIYMIGGYLSFALITALGINPWAALLLTALVLAGLGVLVERFCFRPFVGDFNSIVMVGVAITVILQTTVNIMVGTKTWAVPPLADGIMRIGFFSASYQRIITFAIGALLLGTIIWFVNRTRWGQQMQAIAQNMEGASLQGINVPRVSATACAIGFGFAGIAGCLMGALFNLNPFMGDFMLVKVLILVILAGVGSVAGTFITGLVLGALNSILPLLVVGSVSDAIAIAIVIILLLIRPKGFFGHEA